MANEKEEKKPAEKKLAPKKPRPKKTRRQYGSGKLKAVQEIRAYAEALVELQEAAAKFPNLKDVFAKEIVRHKAAIKSRLERV